MLFRSVLSLTTDQLACIQAGSGVAGPYTISQIIGFAQAALASTAATDDYKLCLSGVLDGLNNNTVGFRVVSPTPCPFISPY